MSEATMRERAAVVADEAATEDERLCTGGSWKCDPNAFAAAERAMQSRRLGQRIRALPADDAELDRLRARVAELEEGARRMVDALRELDAARAALAKEPHQ